MHVLRVEQGLPNGSPMALALDAGGRIYVGMQRAGLLAGETGRLTGLAAAADWRRKILSRPCGRPVMALYGRARWATAVRLRDGRRGSFDDCERPGR